MRNKFALGLLSLLTATTLAACGSANEEVNQNEEVNTGPSTEENTEIEKDSGSTEGMDDSAMNHSGSGEVPEGLKEAENPTYPINSKAIINADHMPGMKGAEATIVGAFDTTAYVVTYTPNDGGEPVKNHKWVIHEEIVSPGREAPLEPGTEVTLNADHMEGMMGAIATIESAEETTVYMVDYEDQETGEEVTNHKWVTESELTPVK